MPGTVLLDDKRDGTAAIVGGNLKPSLSDDQIPSDVLVEILVRLPVKTLSRFKSVCKDWYTLINSSLFTQLHLNKSFLFNFRHNRTFFYTNDDSLCVVDDIYRPSKPITVYWPKDTLRNGAYVHVVGSCNGLVCLRITGPTSKISCFLICNPWTHSFKIKPTFPFRKLKCVKYWDLSYGFGYDGEHDDYKIVVTPKDWKEGVTNVYIYSFKDDLWKCVTHTPAGSCLKRDSSVVFANNMLHYIVSGLYYRIARFDLSSETWKDDLSFPVVVRSSRWTQVEFGVLDGRLYLRVWECYGYKLWIMKEYGDEDSWSVTHNIPAIFEDNGEYTLVPVVRPLKDGHTRLLFELKHFEEDIPQFVWYDPYDNTTGEFKLEISSTDSLLHLCIPSLIKIPGSSDPSIV